MNPAEFLYILFAFGVTSEDKTSLQNIIRQENFFSGLFTSFLDRGANSIAFTCDAVGGSTPEVSIEEVSRSMHELGLSFPNATFFLLVENVSTKSRQYAISVHGGLYQLAEIVSCLPDLTMPIPYDQQRQNIPQNDYAQLLFNKTNFNFPYQQKIALFHALDGKDPLPPDVLIGLVNFLGQVEDWVEQEGKYVYPNLNQIEPEKSIQLSNKKMHDDILGKEVYISSSGYYSGELFKSAVSRCVGITEDLNFFHFRSDYLAPHHMHLEGVNRRIRSHVFLNRQDILDYLKTRMEYVTQTTPHIKDYPYLLLHPAPNISVEFVKPVKNLRTGEFKLVTPFSNGYFSQFQLPEGFTTSKTYIIQNEAVQIFNRTDLESLSKAIENNMRPYLLELGKNQNLV